MVPIESVAFLIDLDRDEDPAFRYVRLESVELNDR
jgi:hypothetical protein